MEKIPKAVKDLLLKAIREGALSEGGGVAVELGPDGPRIVGSEKKEEQYGDPIPFPESALPFAKEYASIVDELQELKDQAILAMAKLDLARKQFDRALKKALPVFADDNHNAMLDFKNFTYAPQIGVTEVESEPQVIADDIARRIESGSMVSPGSSSLN